MKFEPLRAEHVLWLRDMDPAFRAHAITTELALDMEDGGGWVALDGDPVAIGGIMVMRPGVGHAWMWFTRRWRRHAREITARVVVELAECDLPRIEAVVLCGFDAGHRWLRRLGFTLEAERLRRWDGTADYALYARFS